MSDIEKAAAEIISRARAAAVTAAPVLITIDGRCAAGKTTLAAQIREMTACSVIHADDFFLRPEQRTAERLGTPGENIDHERLLAEAILPAYRGESFSYRPFSCKTMSLGEELHIENTPFIIVEGSYSCHPSLRGYYALKVFLTVDSKEQLRRIEQRNGSAALKMFREKWIPLEEKYFSAYDIEKNADMKY